MAADGENDDGENDDGENEEFALAQSALATCLAALGRFEEAASVGIDALALLDKHGVE